MVMGLLDSLFPASDGGGLLDFMKRNAELQPMSAGLPSDQADYGGAALPPMAAPAMNARAQMPVPQIVPQNPAPVIQAPQPAPSAVAMPAGAGGDPGFMTGYQNFRHGGGLLGSLVAGMTGQRNDPQGVALQQQAQTSNMTARMLISHGFSPQDAIALVQPGNQAALGEVLKQIAPGPTHSQEKDANGNVWDVNRLTGERKVSLNREEKTPTSVAEYQYYLQNVPKGVQPMDYATFSTQKARAGATNISNNVDLNNGQTYDKQLTEGLGKAHAGLANGVEEAQTRARDVAAMQGALDAIQRNGGTTGGMGQQQILDLKKTINAGAAALGIENPFSEGDISDKEFLTKFNRQMAGNMAKSAVGSRVTNFEMSNYLKANPGLDMSITGNQRLLGIQAQIEQRNIAVGNAIRQATAEAIAAHKTIDPVQVQKLITDYDEAHHIKDPITGQDLTQSYVLPEFQNANTSNKSMADDHAKNVKRLEKTIGGKTYHTNDGGKTWYVD